MRPRTAAAAACLLLGARLACGQANYEIQVYGSDTVERGATMLELHGNFAAQGAKTAVDGVAADHHALHETLELTRGFNDWFELGFYVFTAEGAGRGWSWVGDHLRPRLRVPASWGWPVGASLSGEIGYQRRLFSTDTWTLEIRPIVDKKWGRWYLSFNPALDLSLKGENAGKAPAFSPSLKASYDLGSAAAVGLEYYGALGSLSGFDPLSAQQHQLFAALDLDLDPRLEINLAAGYGLTYATDRWLLKAILGWRLGP